MSAITDIPRGAKVVGTIDITVTWEAALPILIAGLVNGTTEGRRLAIEQLGRMAEIADYANTALIALKAIVANHDREAVQTHLDGTDLADAMAAIAKAEGRANG